MNPQEVAKWGKQYGFPIIIRPNLDNAFYVPHGNEKITHKIQDPVVRGIYKLRSAPSGGIVVGKNVLNPTILAHEIGHGLDKSLLGNSAGSISSTWNKYNIPLWSTIAPSVAGRIFPEYQNTAHLVNIGLQALSTVPTLYSEYTASEKAKEIYPEADTKMLDTMMNSYVVGLAKKRLAPALIGYGINSAVNALVSASKDYVASTKPT